MCTRMRVCACVCVCVCACVCVCVCTDTTYQKKSQFCLHFDLTSISIRGKKEIIVERLNQLLAPSLNIRQLVSHVLRSGRNSDCNSGTRTTANAPDAATDRGIPGTETSMVVVAVVAARDQDTCDGNGPVAIIDAPSHCNKHDDDANNRCKAINTANIDDACTHGHVHTHAHAHGKTHAHAHGPSVVTDIVGQMQDFVTAYRLLTPQIQRRLRGLIYIYIYTYTYTCIYMNIYTHVYMYTYILVYMYIHIHIYI